MSPYRVAPSQPELPRDGSPTLEWVVAAGAFVLGAIRLVVALVSPVPGRFEGGLAVVMLLASVGWLVRNARAPRRHERAAVPARDASSEVDA